jgi:hypothetical protein
VVESPYRGETIAYATHFGVSFGGNVSALSDLAGVVDYAVELAADVVCHHRLAAESIRARIDP